MKTFIQDSIALWGELGGVGFEVIPGKKNAFEGGPSPKIKCWKEGGHT